MLQSRHVLGWTFIFVVISFSSLTASCSRGVDVTGRWQEIDAQATLVFRADGSFTAVDNQGMRVNGRYQLYEDGRVRFDIRHPDGSLETVRGNVDLSADVLTFMPDDNGGIERYCRIH